MVAIFLRFVKFLESFIIVHISHYSLLVIILCIFKSFIYLFIKLKTKLNFKKLAILIWIVNLNEVVASRYIL